MTAVEKLKSPRGYRAVYVDGDLVLQAHYRCVEVAGLRPGATFSSDELESTITAAQEDDAYRQAIEVLAGRDRTQTELARRLARRKFPQPIIATVLDRLRNKGLIDDHRYARQYVRTISERRGSGPAALRAKLARLGVASSAIDDALKAELPGDAQLEVAMRVARRRLPRLRRFEGEEARSRLYSFIIRRGFDYDTATQVISELLDDE